MPTICPLALCCRFGKRSYHHTGPVSTLYAMREALAIVAEEGLGPMWKRHQEMHAMLWDGLSKVCVCVYVYVRFFVIACVCACMHACVCART